MTADPTNPPPLTEEEERKWRSDNEAVVFPSNQLRRLFATLDAERAELRSSRARIQELEEAMREIDDLTMEEVYAYKNNPDYPGGFCVVEAFPIHKIVSTAIGKKYIGEP